MIVSHDQPDLPLWEIVQRTGDAIWNPKGGLNALKRLNEINYDIDAVVMDLELEDHNGFRLTEDIRVNESIRNREKGCLIFWMTKYTINPTTLKKKSELRVMEIFLKPMTAPAIVERVKRYLTNGVAAMA
jgi:CheY-like chemotaxis protein